MWAACTALLLRLHPTASVASEQADAEALPKLLIVCQKTVAPWDYGIYSPRAEGTGLLSVVAGGRHPRWDWRHRWFLFSGAGDTHVVASTLPGRPQRLMPAVRGLADTAQWLGESGDVICLYRGVFEAGADFQSAVATVSVEPSGPRWRASEAPLGDVVSLSCSRDGPLVVVQQVQRGPGGGARRSKLLRYELDDGTTHRLTGLPDDILEMHPLCSPDGHKVAFEEVDPESGRRVAVVLDLGDGAVRPLGPRADPLWQSSRVVDWRPDGSAVLILRHCKASGRGASTLGVVELSRWDKVSRVPAQMTEVLAGAWSPDGRHVAYVTASDSVPSHDTTTAVCVWDVRDGDYRYVYDTTRDKQDLFPTTVEW